jgi:hypothetical protein
MKRFEQLIGVAIAMTSSVIVGFCAIATSGVALAQSAPGTSQVPAPDIELSSAVRQELEKLALPKVSEPLKSIKFAVKSGSLDFFYEPFENGLWGVAQLSTGSRGKVVQRLITLSGLIVLGGTLDALSEQDIPVFGRAPFSLPLKHTTIRTFRAENLSGDLAVLTSPAPGAKFSYELSMHVGSRTSDRVDKASCVVENKADAATLHPKLRGSYLPVTCEETRDGRDSSRQYAYLVESKVYVLTNISGGFNEGSYRFAEVQYAEPK